MTRILHLIPGLTGGGAERQLTLLAPAQAALGHEVHIGVVRNDIPSSLAGASSVRVHTLKLRNNHDPLLVPRIYSLVRSVGAEVVQTWLTMMDISGATAARLARKPWILSERSEAAAYPSSLKNNLRLRFGRGAHAIVANSAGGVAYWTANGVPASRLTEIRNAVDTGVISNAPLLELPEACRQRPLVLFVGRLSEEKMPFVLIDALALALRSTNAAAMLCGVGPLGEDMQAAIDSHDMHDRILMAGHRPDVFGLLRQASVCVAISRFEGSPNVVLEAMAAECPLIVSDIPAYRELLDESSALFVPVDDAAATAHAIEQVLASAPDAKARALRASARTATLTPAFVASALDNVYDRVLGASARNASGTTQ